VDVSSSRQLKLVDGTRQYIEVDQVRRWPLVVLLVLLVVLVLMLLRVLLLVLTALLVVADGGAAEG